MLEDTVTLLPFDSDELVCLWNVRSARWQAVADWLDGLHAVERVHLGRYGCSVELAPHLRKAPDLLQEVAAGLTDPSWEVLGIVLQVEHGTVLHQEPEDGNSEPWQQ